MRYALDDDYDNLIATMQRIGFIQPGEKVSVQDIDDMIRQYVEPLEAEIFHFTRRWLQRMTAVNMNKSVRARSRPRGRWTSRPSSPSRCG